MRKNIGIIVKSLKGGGAERAAANLSKDLSEQYNVYLLVFDATDISYPYEGTIVDLNTLPAISKFGKVINFIKRYFRIKSAKKKYNFCATISFMPSANLLNVFTRYNDKVIVSIRNMMSQRSRTQLQNKLIGWVGNKADMTVALSEGVRLDLINKFNYSPNKVLTIYNSCDINWFLRQDESIEEMMERFDFEQPILVMTGRLTHQKGQWHALRAFSLVLKEIPMCQLVIFGEGELKEKFEQYAIRLGISQNVQFQGFVKNYHSFLLKARVFLFPSLYEGLGNVILEALACGLPVISANCPFGPEEILNPSGTSQNNEVTYGEYGVMIPAFSNKSFDEFDVTFEESDSLLANAIIKLLKEKDLIEYYRKQSLKRANDFSPIVIKKQWFNLMEEMLNE